MLENITRNSSFNFYSMLVSIIYQLINSSEYEILSFYVDIYLHDKIMLSHFNVDNENLNLTFTYCIFY